MSKTQAKNYKRVFSQIYKNTYMLNINKYIYIYMFLFLKNKIIKK